MPDAPARRVRAELELSVAEPTDIVLQVVVADLPSGSTESLSITVDNVPVHPNEVHIPGEGRAHRLVVAAGKVDIRYEALIVGQAPVPVATVADEITYLRPSRYAEADRLVPFATAEFAGIRDRRELVAAVPAWVGSHLNYVPGSSRPTDGAVETSQQRQGVCRDYAHLVVALLRAMDVPARFAAVYAPGLGPMDFHAVAEAVIDSVWYVVDATLLAPRTSLVRICSGRDAADTAFLSTYSGQAELRRTQVWATVEGDLPRDTLAELVMLR